MTDWIPVVFVAFKMIVLSTGMFFAIKWHYDQGRKQKALNKAQEHRAVLRAGGTAAVVFALSLLVLGRLTYFLMGTLGMDLTFP